MRAGSWRATALVLRRAPMQRSDGTGHLGGLDCWACSESRALCEHADGARPASPEAIAAINAAAGEDPTARDRLQARPAGVEPLPGKARSLQDVRREDDDVHQCRRRASSRSIVSSSSASTSPTVVHRSHAGARNRSPWPALSSGSWPPWPRWSRIRACVSGGRSGLRHRRERWRWSAPQPGARGDDRRGDRRGRGKQRCDRTGRSASCAGLIRAVARLRRSLGQQTVLRLRRPGSG